MSQAEVTHKVPPLPQRGLHHQQDLYHTLILDYDRETPQCHTDKGQGFSLYEPVSFSHVGMSSEGNIFPSASDSNFAEVGHRRESANVRETFVWQGEQLWGAGCFRAVEREAAGNGIMWIKTW